MGETIRVLQVVSNMNCGGSQAMLMNYYRNIDRDKVQFDFLEHYQSNAYYDNEITVLGGKIYHLPMMQPFSIAYRRALKQFFDAHTEYRVIHVHLNCLCSIVLKEAQKHGVPVRIAHSHSTAQEKDLKYPIKMFYRKYIPKYATHLFACSEAAGEWLFRGAKFQILRNAIDAKLYQYNPQKRGEVRKQIGIQENTTLVGHVGRFEIPKNHAYLIDIFSEIQKRVDAKLLLVGNGPLRGEMEKKAAELGIADNVVFAGERSDVPDLLQAMDVFVLPSTREGLPVTIVEAQAAGLPCLISDKVPIECSVTDLVRQIKLSELPEFWAEKAVKAARRNRKNTYEEIKTAGYDIQNNAELLKRVYLNCLTNHYEHSKVKMI